MNGQPNNKIARTRCEIWTRVMGYHRPVSSWNTGKQGEHAERKFFTEKAAASGLRLTSLIVLLLAILVTTGCAGRRDSLRPYVGVPALDCEELRADMIDLADRIDTRSLMNNGASFVSTGTQVAVVAGVITPAAAALPLALGGFRLGADNLHRAIAARYQAALRLGCDLPETMLENEDAEGEL